MFSAKVVMGGGESGRIGTCIFIWLSEKKRGKKHKRM